MMASESSSKPSERPKEANKATFDNIQVQPYKSKFSPVKSHRKHIPELELAALETEELYDESELLTTERKVKNEKILEEFLAVNRNCNESNPNRSQSFHVVAHRRPIECALSLMYTLVNGT